MMNMLQNIALSIPGIPRIDVNQDTLQNALSVTFTVIGGLAVLFLLIGAARYAVSSGDAALIKQAKETIVYSIIGLIVSISAFFIVQFVLGGVTG